MSFIIDKQTLDDLKIFGKNQEKSVFSLFSGTKTHGGVLLLEEMFHYPFSDANVINKRNLLISYFCEKGIKFPFRGELFTIAEEYLNNTDNRSRLDPEGNNIQQKFRSYVGANTEYDRIGKGIGALIEIINEVRSFVECTELMTQPALVDSEITELVQMIREFDWVEKGKVKLTYAKTVEYDRSFRYENGDLLKRMLHLIYLLDVYISVAEVAVLKKYTFAQAVEGGDNEINIEGLYHPFLETPVANTVRINKKNNVLFLTGANMAGKSTFMKSFGITMFLAHMGFPVPAEKMVFTVQNGMYTTINLPDNLNMGYSHFYAEVLRLKKIAEQVSRSRNLIVIFDELFRGTNVKDAYDATVAVVEAFARKQNSTFIISTHIVEAGEELKGKCDNVRFVYLPTVMQDKKPCYTYKLKEGITDDRHGMIIINNEHIVEIIKGTC